MTALLSALFSIAIAWANPSASFYDLGHSWTTQDGKSVSLADLKGHITVVTMVFTSCPGVCPLMVSDIKLFDGELTPEERKRVRYVLFSFDPDRDTPENLKKFFNKMKLDHRWTLLTSNAEQAREISSALGFAYKDLGNGDFTHSSSLFLLSKNGEILARKERRLDWNEFLKKFRQK